MLPILREAAEKVGGVPELARRLGVTRQAIYQWVEVPVERAAELERVTGISRSRFRPDFFAGQHEPSESAGYDQDYHAWLMRQASLLSEQRFGELDLANLIEEIEDLVRSEKREISSRLGQLLKHLLKWCYQPEQRTGSWESSILQQRVHILKRLQESPSLRVYPAEILESEYVWARRVAALETGLPIDSFPTDCPFTVAQALDPDFLP